MEQTAKEFIIDKILTDSNSAFIDKIYNDIDKLAILFEEYHETKVENLGLFDVRQVCENCGANDLDEDDLTADITCMSCGKKQTELLNCDFNSKNVRELLKEANGIIRSFYSVIKRKGETTNWNALQLQVKRILDEQHELKLYAKIVDCDFCGNPSIEGKTHCEGCACLRTM